MHEYTRLIKDDFLNKMKTKCEDEVDQFAAEWAKRGFSLPNGGLISGILDIRFKWLDSLMEEIFNAEKAALSKGEAILSPDLAGELNIFFQQEVDTIRSNALRDFGGKKGPARDSIIAITGEKEASIRESINRRVQIMEHELKLGISKSETHQTIQVTGDGAVVNVGQVFGSIKTTVQRISGPGATELADAFLHIAQGIKDSNVNEEDKKEQLENVEFLVTQYEIPEQQRKKGLIRSAIRSLGEWLPTATNLATVWAQYGPSIMKAFGVE